jgi:DNA replication ATP-dependent helicase Dna2
VIQVFPCCRYTQLPHVSICCTLLTILTFSTPDCKAQIAMSANHNSYVSANSRSKLNNFRYLPKEEDILPPKTSPSKPNSQTTAHADKENQVSWINGVADPPKSPYKSQPSTQVKDVKTVKECPKTPANRIPLADLISNTEDAFKLPGKEQTPEDYISWQHAPQSSGPIGAIPATKSKKRRHSSSPSSSPLKDGSTTKPTESFDMKTFQSVMRTPQSDMAADLWNNYIGKSKLEEGIELPKFANLSSSPQTPFSQRAGRDSSGLRRSLSCNVDWPSSKAKRRRVEGADGVRTARDIFSRSKSNVLDSGNSKKLSFLLDKIQDSLTKSKSNVAAGPPSSPPLCRENVPADRSPSPREGGRKLQAAGRHIPRVAMGEDDVERPCETRQKIKSTGSSSDFGDDFDEDLLALVESSTDPFEDSVKPERVMSHISIDKPGYNPDNSPCPAEHVGGKKLVNPNANTHNDDDEFDDDDDFPESMEDLLAQYDKKTPAQQSKSRPQPVLGLRESGQIDGRKSDLSNQPELLEKSGQGASGDEFDDDDFDVSAIENTILQSGMDSRNQVGHP